MSKRPQGSVPAVVLSGQIGSPRAAKSINHIALAIARSLGRHAVPVYRFHPNRRLYDLHSRYCRHVRCPNLYDHEQELVEALRQFARAQGQAPVVFASSDGSASFLSRHAEQLSQNCRLVVAPAGCIAEIQDKGRLYRRAVQLGLAVPKTFEPASEEEARAAAAALDYPAVIKPLTSHHWKAATVSGAVNGAKAVEVSSPAELLAVYRRVAALAPRLMIQEIVPGPDERLLTFLGYFDRAGAALAGCVRKKLRQSPPRFGYCCLTETVQDEEAMRSAIRLLEGLGYRGIGCVEFKRDPRDGLLKLIEINTRAVRTTGMAIGAGVDLPYIAYRDMLGLPVAPCFRYRVGMRWMHLMDELLAARELIRGGQLTVGQWLKVFRAPLVEAEWAWDDPVPFLRRTGRMLVRLLLGAVGRLIVRPVLRGMARSAAGLADLLRGIRLPRRRRLGAAAPATMGGPGTAQGKPARKRRRETVSAR